MGSESKVSYEGNGVDIEFIKQSANSQLPQALKDGAHDEQGVELYYNIAVNPWLHITPNLQVIDPADKSVDTTVVAGVRVKMDF